MAHKPFFNELKEQLVSPHLAFVQIWHLQGYGQYNIINIINVLANVNITQSILPHLPHDERTIGLSLNRQMEYKLPYLIGNVRSSHIMTTLHDFFNTSLYKDYNISIHTQWLDMFTLSHQTHSINNSCEANDVPCDNYNEDEFEEEQEDISINTMVQNILSFEQIYDYFENVIHVALGKEFKPLGPFQDIHCEELNFSTLFFGQPCSNQGKKMSYQTIV
jgi:hypothetical protein